MPSAHAAVRTVRTTTRPGRRPSGRPAPSRSDLALEDVDRGAIRIGDQDVTDVAPKLRDIAMVFQNYALYPHMTVRQNMGFALKLAGTGKQEREQKVVEAARLLHLEEYLDRKPKALSGGQRQRVAMGRAIVREPQVFLMDEPLSNLDAKLRVQTRTEIASLQRRLGITTVYVTHDQVEAMTMGDRVAVLKDGVLQQAATPREMYDRPSNVFVAGFIGSPGMNLAEVPLTEEGARLGDLLVPVPRETRAASGADGRIVLGFRPESLHPAGDGDGFDVHVDVVEELGSDAYLYGTPVDQTLTGQLHGTGAGLVARVDPRRPPAKGDVVRLGIRPGEAHVFSVSTGARLSD